VIQKATENWMVRRWFKKGWVEDESALGYKVKFPLKQNLI
jgi:hypothetical protein